MYRSAVFILFLLAIAVVPSELLAQRSRAGQACAYAGWSSRTGETGVCIPRADTNQTRCPNGEGLLCNPQIFQFRHGGKICIAQGSQNTTYSCLRQAPWVVRRYADEDNFRAAHSYLGPDILLYCRTHASDIPCKKLQEAGNLPRIDEMVINGKVCSLSQPGTMGSSGDSLLGTIAKTLLPLGAVLGGAALLTSAAAQNAAKKDEQRRTGDLGDPTQREEIMAHSLRRSSSPSGGGPAPMATRNTSYEPIEGTIAMQSSGGAPTMRGEEQVNWDECAGGSQSGRQSENFSEGMIGGYFLDTPNRCGDRRISKNLMDFINNHLAQCIQDSLGDQGVSGNVSSVMIGHRGITGDTNHSSRSLHSVNRAIDVATFHIKLDNGEVLERSANNLQRTEPHMAFFASFRSCWSEKIVENHEANCPGSVPKGTIGCEDSNHQGHIHLSLPYCPNQGFFVK